MSDSDETLAEAVLKRLGEIDGKVDTVLSQQDGIAVAINHWADEVLRLRESYRHAIGEVSSLTERVARLERRASSPAMPAPSGKGNGADS